MAGTIKADTIQSELTTPTVFRNSSGTEIGRIIRVFINFNTVTTSTISKSFNVSSITDNGTGDTTVTYSLAFGDSNYSFMGTIQGVNAGVITLCHAPTGTQSPTTTITRFLTLTSGAASGDTPIVCVTYTT